MRLAWIPIAAVACGSSTQTPLYKAGDEKDEGAGLLARASSRLVTGDDTEPGFAIRPGTTTPAYGGEAYGGGMYGGDPYGGASYAHWAVPQWTYQQPNRAPRYTVATTGLDAAIEGVVTWEGPSPAKLATACGAIEATRLGANRGLRGAVVYIDRIATGRAFPYYGRPATVGGVITKRGCAFAPQAQIVVPLPATITIHGDAQRTRVRVAPAAAAPKLIELQEGGLAQVEIKPGVTKVDGEDGTLAAAWVLGLETPYYAITDDTGHFRIDELAPGTYDVTYWVPPLASIGADGLLVYGPPIATHQSVHTESHRITQVSVALGKH